MEEEKTIKELLHDAKLGDMDAAAHAVYRIQSSLRLVTSNERYAVEFRIGAGPKACDAIRSTCEQAMRELSVLFRLNPVYSAAGFTI